MSKIVFNYICNPTYPSLSYYHFLIDLFIYLPKM